MGNVNWLGFEREALKEKLLVLADRQKYEAPITEEESALLGCFDCLNIKKDTETNIENFFEVLDEVIYFANKRGEVAENGDD